MLSWVVPVLHPEAWDALDLPADVVHVVMDDVDAQFDTVESALIGDFGR